MKITVIRPDHEKREGIIFVGDVKQLPLRFGVKVDFYTESTKCSVGRVYLADEGFYRRKAEIVDHAFQKWVKTGLFRKTVKDPSLLKILEIAGKERNDGVECYKKTHRFLPVNERPDETMYIFTTDKSDVPERVKRIWEIGEEAVKAEEKAENKKRIAYGESKVLNDLPNVPTIRAAVLNAVEKKQRVVLVVKGFRPMFVPMAEFGYNYFWFEDYDGDGKRDFGCVPVPTVCRILGVDPVAVQQTYFSENREQSFEERAQSVAELFPFEEIEWKRQSGSTGEIYRLAITRKDEAVIA